MPHINEYKIANTEHDPKLNIQVDIGLIRYANLRSSESDETKAQVNGEGFVKMGIRCKANG